jgi:hypothetical protein
MNPKTTQSKTEMQVANIILSSDSEYSQSRCHETPKLSKESANDYEVRTWRERLHYTESGEVYIPQMALKNCLTECAKYLGIQIPGKGKSTYSKHFKAGLLILNPILLGIQKDDVSFERLFVPADGVTGSGKRVWKYFPKISEWSGESEVFILDDTITREVFEQHLDQAGRFTGLGRFRPSNGGFYGRSLIGKKRTERQKGERNHSPASAI